MNPFEFVLALMIIIFGFAIIRQRFGMAERRGREPVGDQPARDAENDRLRGQVQQMQERIRVLERIVTDGGIQTAAQIEALRDRESGAEEDKG
jgi:preprotein translocase subunit YajC